MTLAAGTRLGPYEILAPLGAGGMGEVYRARDTRLTRDVAVKVLPQHLSSNPEIRARFDREAKSVSSLNHPHICTLFDVGRAPGVAGSGEIDYLVMELIDGETLAQRVGRGPLPGGDVLKIGGQIADALDRAHRAGVVHRDLKPGNIMLTRSGAKLMDFGLARVTGLAAGPGSSVTVAALTHSPTVAGPLTAEGTLIGTFQYMSPEQLEGKEADERADIWALGCVLYEMATGRRAFEGRSQASLISAIMSTEPAPVSVVAPLAPPGLDRLVRTCLTKDPDERIRTAHDVKLQLAGIAEGGSQVGAPAGVATPAARRGGGRLAWAVAAVATLAAIALAIPLATRDRGATPPVQLSFQPTDRELLPIYSSTVAISPDGRFVAYCAFDTANSNTLWLRRLDSPEAVRLLKVGPPATIFWSPDSRTIGLLPLTQNQMLRIPIEGGSPTSLTRTSGPRGATWNSKGVILYAPTVQGALFRLPASGGEAVQVTTPDSARGESGHRFPFFLPDGDHFLYVSMPPGAEGNDIYVGSLSSRTVRKLLVANSAVTYAEPGYLLYRRGAKLVAQRFDPKRLALQGEPVAIADAPPESDLDAEPVATASRDGRLVSLDSRVPDTQLGWFDRSGTPLGILPLPAGAWGRPRISPDGRFAAVPKGDDIWRIELGRSIPLRLTTGQGYQTDPVWSPDGSKIAYTLGRSGREEVYTIASDGSGEPKLVPTTRDLFKSADDWTAAGILVTDIAGPSFRDILLASPDGEAPARPLIASRFSEFNSRVSRDGRWIAYLSSEAGVADVYVQSFPQPGHKLRVSSNGADRVWWTAAGDEILYRSISGTMMSVKLTRRGEDLEAGEPVALFRYPPGSVGSDVTPDGRRTLISYPSRGAHERNARVILDWTSLLSR